MSATKPHRALLPVAILALGVLLLRLAYLAWACPYDLVEDEAFYWLWSRHLDWSYYTKGPGIAWAIRASTFLLGDTEFGVRAVAAFSAAVSTFAVGALAADVADAARADHDRRVHSPAVVGLLAAAFFNLAPGFQITSLLATIDGPFLACWSIAAWAAWRALARGSARAWVLLGAALGVGFLFKYTILLFLPGLLVAAASLRHRQPAPPSARPAQTLGALAFAAGLAPVILWNLASGGAGLRHLLGRIGLASESAAAATTTATTTATGPIYSPLWTIELIAAQFAVVGPALATALLAIYTAWLERGRRPAAASGRAFLIAIGLPPLAFYLAVTLLSPAEGNWPIAAHLTLIPLAAWWTIDAWQDPVARQLTWLTALVGAVAGLGMLRLDAIHAAAASSPVAKAIPLGRLIGAKELAAQVDGLRREHLAQTGREPLVIAQTYGRAAQLAFYLPGRPTVYCASSRTGGRTVQHDFWPDTNLASPALRNSDAILVGGEAWMWSPAFTRLRPLGRLRGEHRKNHESFIGYGYRGFRVDTTPSAPPPQAP